MAYGKVDCNLVECCTVNDASIRVIAHELVEHVDAATQLLDLDTAQNPGTDPFLYHIILIFTPECFPFLREVLWRVELRGKVLLFI